MVTVLTVAPSRRDHVPTLGERKRRLAADLDWARRMTVAGASALDRERADDARQALERELAAVSEKVAARKWKSIEATIVAFGACMVGWLVSTILTYHLQ